MTYSECIKSLEAWGFYALLHFRLLCFSVLFLKITPLHWAEKNKYLSWFCSLKKGSLRAETQTNSIDWHKLSSMWADGASETFLWGDQGCLWTIWNNLTFILVQRWNKNPVDLISSTETGMLDVAQRCKKKRRKQQNDHQILRKCSFVTHFKRRSQPLSASVLLFFSLLSHL